ncbi:MAG: ATP-grasp domain-containing protein [Cellulosilyticaceae bacterium]
MGKKNIRTLGIIGGNLEAALLCQQARLRGIKTTLLEQDLNNIATHFADEHITAPINNETLKKLSRRVESILFCTDSIPKVAEQIAKEYPLFPSHQGLELIAGRIQQIQFAKSLEIPVPHHFYQNNKEDFFEDLENLELPFRFYQVFDTYHEVMEVLTPEELSEFIFEVNDEAREWLLESIGTYDKILSVTALKDQTGKIVLYPIQDEELDAEDVKYITTPAVLTKTATQKIQRYVRKMMKAMATEGLMCFKFGIQKNKSIELLHINAGITLGDIATCHYADFSVYEQYISMLLGEPIYEPTLHQASKVTIILENDEENRPEGPYHKYVVDHQAEGAVSIYVSAVPQEA